MDIEIARQEWDEGRRRLEGTASNPAEYERLLLHVEIVTAELRRRIGQTFSVGELAVLYDGSERWALEALHSALDEDAPAETAIAADAAFSLYARRAYDYEP